MKTKKVLGFTLIELLIYTSVFVVAAGLLTTILITTSRVENNEIVSTQVGQELNLILETVQRLVRDSSLVECVNTGPADTNCSASTGTNLKLRFQSTSIDPTCVYLESGTVKIAQGPNVTNPQLCNTAAAQVLTTSKVTANSLTFTKFDNSGGHATVQIDAQLTYNSQNPALQISKTLRSAVGRVSAATFDSDILPDTNNSRSIGSAVGSKTWKDIFISGLISAGKAVIGGTTASSKLLTITNVASPTVGPLENGLAIVLDNGGGVYFKDEGSAEGKLESYQGNIAVGSVSNHPLQFWTNNSVRATIESDGDFGIATSTPGYRLDVQGGQVNASGGLCIAGDCRASWAAAGSVIQGTAVYATSTTAISGYIYTGIVQSGGTWTTKTSMPTDREGPLVATVAGKVYVIGGEQEDVGPSDANEVYDPATNAWTTKATLPTDRAYLGGGAVGTVIYAIGGNAFAGDSNVNEAYDTVANTWSTKAVLPGTARRAMGSGVVGTSIYMMGGISGDPTFTFYNRNDAYNTVANTWSVKASMNDYLRAFGAAAAVGNTIYLLGGEDDNQDGLANNSAYDTVANTWTNKAFMPKSKTVFAAVSIGNTIYALGGHEGDDDVGTVVAYDVTTDLWSNRPPMRVARNGLGAAVVGSTIYAIGGAHQLGYPTYSTNEAFVDATYYIHIKN